MLSNQVELGGECLSLLAGGRPFTAREHVGAAPFGFKGAGFDFSYLAVFIRGLLSSTVSIRIKPSSPFT